MQQKLNKHIILLLILLVGSTIFTSSCSNKTVDNDLVTTPQPTPTSTPTPSKNPQKSITMPTLPDLDFEGMDFFEDGYEIVEFKGSVDGDTATFMVGGLPVNTRFLAVDTPETNSATYGVQPWGLAAKAYTTKALENAEVIILEMDEESDIWDDYSRLLAWLWVDGELLNYKLVEEGLASVKYLYGNYKYNPTMIALESSIQKKKIKIWGEDDPDYDYNDSVTELTLADVRTVQKGSNAKISGIVTNKIGKNAFIQTESGAIYIYANKYNYSALEVGNEVSLIGKVLEYNNLLEISDIQDKKITLVSEGNIIQPQLISLSNINEQLEAKYIQVDNVTVTAVDAVESQKGYDVIIEQNGTQSIIRIDKYLDPYIDPSFFEIGNTFSVIGNVGQYGDIYQIMISSEDAIIK